MVLGNWRVEESAAMQPYGVTRHDDTAFLRWHDNADEGELAQCRAWL